MSNKFHWTYSDFAEDARITLNPLGDGDIFGDKFDLFNWWRTAAPEVLEMYSASRHIYPAEKVHVGMKELSAIRIQKVTRWTTIVNDTEGLTIDFKNFLKDCVKNEFGSSSISTFMKFENWFRFITGRL